MDKPRCMPSRFERWATRALKGLSLVALVVTPMVAVGVWLVVSDPALAADLAVDGDVWPLVRAVAETLGRALRALLDGL